MEETIEMKFSLFYMITFVDRYNFILPQIRRSWIKSQNNEFH